ncbi:hypothetical protein [Flavobacterium commune]|uniref:Lipoprotein n=1 Tax=Flavobacterium commune TaxID=1306519 RepID=A0A1D9PAQ6_9FLAO|nr:hypothetical protein [Flavobacterium commune]AOZ99404.1 hypothetical protein BIW12_08085 [Flavobacterium commune]
MKKFLSLLFFVGLIFSCASLKDKNQVEGSVESIVYGKDGYTAKIKTDKNQIYLATVSRVNLEQNYKVFKTGNKVVLKGEIWKTDTEKHIKVTEIVLVN